MTTSVTGDLPAEQEPAAPEPATATSQSASPAAGSERVQSRPATSPIPPSTVGRIPVLAVFPGIDAVAATAVLVGPDGVDHSRVRMTLLAPGTDRYGATVVPDAEGRWSFRVEGWSDLYGTWEHAALIKVPAGLDVELMLEEGARVFERALRVPGLESPDVAVLQDAVA